MHELSIAQNIIDIVRQYLPVEGPQQVRIVKVRIGEMAGVVPDSLDFCFNAIIGSTPLEGAALVIEHIPVVIHCMQCGKEHLLDHSAFYCQFCDSTDVRMISGNELQVVEIEVADEQTEAP
ncbi:MAG: hydrogenase maturation nickel metallochaperone HypA [Bacteroidota bacterium]